MRDIFYISLFGGLLFILVAIIVIQGEGIKWYLIGMGQIMMVVGLIGLIGVFATRHKGKEANDESTRE